MTDTMPQRYTGARTKRVEDERILTGSGEYVDDVKLPGLLHAAFVRSPLAHATITNIDLGGARDAPGVVAVYTGEDLEALVHRAPNAPAPSFTTLATTKVRVVGDPVVLVVADTRYLAEDACDLIAVDYEELPAVATFDDARDPSIPPIFEGSNVAELPRATFGDVDGVFANVDRVVRAHLDVHRHQNVPMEGQAIVADFDPAAGTLTIHASTQGVHPVRNAISTALGIDRSQVHVIAKEIGGSFGLKFGTSREQIAAAAASKDLGRPVKWIEDRTENLTISGQAREESFDLELGVTNDGDVLGLKIDMILDQGAYPGMGAMVPTIMQGVVVGPYKMQALDFCSTVVTSNKASYVAYRGPWASETFLRERLFNLAAAELGMDPLELRLRNVATQQDTMITGRSLRSCTARESLERIRDVVDFPGFRRRQEAARAEGRYLGIGIATFIEGAPGPRGEGEPLGRERMRATVDTDGTVLLFTGQMPHGQGHQTTFAQVAADQLGVPFEQVRVVVGDSDRVPGGATGGSRAATMAGGASLHVARTLKERIKELGAELLEASVDDLEVTGGKVGVRGTPVSALSFAELATAVADGRTGEGASLAVETTFDGGEGGWSGGTHCAEVEVDIDTGIVQVRRYVVAEDCGELINPAIVEGQVRGGVAQGIGAVLLEKSAYDENGQFMSASFMDYLLPTTTEVPTIEIEHLETTPLDPDVNFRGVGEGGMIVAPATLVNAIEDALSPFGVKIYEQHLPPTRILELIGAIDPE